ncbi:MAG: hypothetical protein M0Z28_13040 [Rhodospirillales bacterium]|jgi:hypothetical protein|nr:hypothetical protein [Rhodospirillales bacterium]
MNRTHREALLVLSLNTVMENYLHGLLKVRFSVYSTDAPGRYDA